MPKRRSKRQLDREHEERLAIINRPFFTTRFDPSYLWAGRNTGGYLFADVSGGHQVQPVGNPDDMGVPGSAYDSYRAHSLIVAQRMIVDHPDPGDYVCVVCGGPMEVGDRGKIKRLCSPKCEKALSRRRKKPA